VWPYKGHFFLLYSQEIMLFGNDLWAYNAAHVRPPKMSELVYLRARSNSALRASNSSLAYPRAVNNTISLAAMAILKKTPTFKVTLAIAVLKIAANVSPKVTYPQFSLENFFLITC
jgi:hypothetical protein